MKGKKSDPEFISGFMAKCIGRGLTTSDEMVNAAKLEIKEIEDKIKEVEGLKIIRSKLLDVIFALDKPKTKEEEAKLLPLFNLQYPQMCKQICDLLRDREQLLGKFNFLTHPLNEEYNFCVKQLLEVNVISRMGNKIVRGPKFDDYVKLVLQYEV